MSGAPLAIDPATGWATGGLVPSGESRCFGEPCTLGEILIHAPAYTWLAAPQRQPSDAERKALARDNAHGDAWAGLTLIGIWDQKITAGDVGKTLGDLVDAAVR